ncbi:hypothetical protein AB0H36_43960 [Kribbella sp. NPDC050820]|uniref:hypothetical protein n=1 Tax=Kribbella sp. NPDC050820 TaxID=3155408 RepID=UPI0033EBB6D6
MSSQMGISPTAAWRYFTDDALADLARTMIIEFAAETPGADVIESPRTAAVPLPIVGRPYRRIAICGAGATAYGEGSQPS